MSAHTSEKEEEIYFPRILRIL